MVSARICFPFECLIYFADIVFSGKRLGDHEKISVYNMTSGTIVYMLKKRSAE